MTCSSSRSLSAALGTRKIPVLSRVRETLFSLHLQQCSQARTANKGIRSSDATGKHYAAAVSFIDSATQDDARTRGLGGHDTLLSLWQDNVLNTLAAHVEKPLQFLGPGAGPGGVLVVEVSALHSYSSCRSSPAHCSRQQLAHAVSRSPAPMPAPLLPPLPDLAVPMLVLTRRPKTMHRLSMLPPRRGTCFCIGRKFM